MNYIECTVYTQEKHKINIYKYIVLYLIIYAYLEHLLLYTRFRNKMTVTVSY